MEPLRIKTVKLILQRSKSLFVLIAAARYLGMYVYLCTCARECVLSGYMYMRGNKKKISHRINGEKASEIERKTYYTYHV